MTKLSIVPAAQVTGRQIAGWLDTGAVVVVPTETVYGLAVKPGNALSIERVFELKGRPTEINLPVMIGVLDQLMGLGVDFNETARLLASEFWPGPLTLVMGFRDEGLRPKWLAGRVEVAIRFPDYDLIRGVAMAAGPILVTSANGHGAGPKRVALEAVASLHGEADFVVDGGTLSPVPSTIINTRYSPATIERMGAVTTEALQEFIRNNRVAPQLG